MSSRSYLLYNISSKRFLNLLLEYPVSRRGNPSADCHPPLLPACTPPFYSFTRVTMTNTSGLRPILSCFPTNAKVGWWDLEPDSIVKPARLSYCLHNSSCYPLKCFSEEDILLYYLMNCRCEGLPTIL